MAITQSRATVDTTERENLRSSNVDTSITTGGAELNTTSPGGIVGFVNNVTDNSFGVETTGATLAGVTPTFAQNVCTEIDNYKAAVLEYLNRLEAANSSVAFQGEGVKAALTTFINSVRDVATSYLNKLSEAEQDIINSVQAAYSTQDTDLASEMNSDSTQLQNTSI